jgi:hypothetical protein
LNFPDARLWLFNPMPRDSKAAISIWHLPCVTSETDFPADSITLMIMLKGKLNNG